MCLEEGTARRERRPEGGRNYLTSPAASRKVTARLQPAEEPRPAVCGVGEKGGSAWGDP